MRRRRHDPFLKRLYRAGTRDALTRFFPDLAARIDWEHWQWIDKEILFRGKRREAVIADLVGETRDVDGLIDLEGEKAGETHKRRAAGVIGVKRVVNLDDARMSLQPLGERQRTVHVAPEAQRQRAQSARQKKSFERRELGAEKRVGDLVDLADETGRAGDNARHRVAMTADIFRRRMEHEIGAVRDRFLEDRRCPGIVDDGDGAPILRRAREPGNILKLEDHGGRALKIE